MQTDEAYGPLAAALIRACGQDRLTTRTAIEAVFDPRREVTLPAAVREAVHRVRSRVRRALAEGTTDEARVRRDLSLRGCEHRAEKS